MAGSPGSPKKKNVDVYTDGACRGNPGPGGWAAILLYRGHRKEISGFVPETTNNRMELTAAVRALERLKEPCAVALYSDSAYLVNAFTRNWIGRWARNGWRLAEKKGDVKNVDLWQTLFALSEYHDITFIKVAGHADDVNNNKCDALAVSEISTNASL